MLRARPPVWHLLLLAGALAIVQLLCWLSRAREKWRNRLR